MPQPRLFVDSADVDAVAELLAAGWIHGVTTNPTVLDRAGLTAADVPGLYTRWEQQGAREIFVQTWGTSPAELERRARAILDLGERAVVKIVAAPAGFALGARLAAEGAPVLLTGVATAGQALAAASAGVRYIAPYLGRLRDAGDGDVELIAAMQRAAGPVRDEVPSADGRGRPGAGTTEVLAASLRSPQDIVDLSERGITAFTAAPSVLHDLIASPATDRADAGFAAAKSVRDGLDLDPSR